MPNEYIKKSDVLAVMQSEITRLNGSSTLNMIVDKLETLTTINPEGVLTPILDSLPPSIKVEGYHIWLNITKELTGSYSGGYLYENRDKEYGFYLNDYKTIELLATAIQGKLNQL